MKKLILIVAVILFSDIGFAQTGEYVCPFIGENILIDGNADENVWNNAIAVNFVANGKEELKAHSWFKAVWDSKYLYFYFWIEDENIIGEMIGRDDHLWNEEVMEIFLDADCNPKTYYEFEWNPKNTLLDLFVLNPNCKRDGICQWWSWDCKGIKSVVKIEGTLNNSDDTDRGWSLEVAIPFSQIQTSLNIPPKSNDIWRFDLTRREGIENDGTLQKSSWIPPSCHLPLSYGKLIFKKE